MRVLNFFSRVHRSTTLSSRRVSLERSEIVVSSVVGSDFSPLRLSGATHASYVWAGVWDLTEETRSRPFRGYGFGEHSARFPGDLYFPLHY